MNKNFLEKQKNNLRIERILGVLNLIIGGLILFFLIILPNVFMKPLENYLKPTIDQSLNYYNNLKISTDSEKELLEKVKLSLYLIPQHSRIMLFILLGTTGIYLFIFGLLVIMNCRSKYQLIVYAERLKANENH